MSSRSTRTQRIAAAVVRRRESSAATREIYERYARERGRAASAAGTVRGGARGHGPRVRSPARHDVRRFPSRGPPADGYGPDGRRRGVHRVAPRDGGADTGLDAREPLRDRQRHARVAGRGARCVVAERRRRTVREPAGAARALSRRAPDVNGVLRSPRISIWRARATPSWRPPRRIRRTGPARRRR